MSGRDIKKELVKYKRADGVELTAVIYTPPGWQEGKDAPLPTLLWAYPRSEPRGRERKRDRTRKKRLERVRNRGTDRERE